MFCPKCATKNPDEARFCRECGAAIAVEQEIEKEKPKDKTGEFFKWVGYIVVGLLLLAILGNF